MDQSSFEDHLDRYGGDLEAWPQVVRSAAARLLATSAAARRSHEAMQAVETVLAARAGPGRDHDAIAAIAMRHRQVRPSRRLAIRAGWGAAAAAVLLLGFSIGTLTPRPHDDSPERVIAAALNSSGSIDVD